jgi:hypothetical protein
MMTTVQKNCLACGDLIFVRLADHRRGWGKFCDKACAAAHKCGQRPRDVKAYHAKFSAWASDRMTHFRATYGDGKPPTAASIKAQVGKVKVVPIYHSPCKCRECGTPIDGPGLCDDCEIENDFDMGWDAHKEWTA